MKLAGTNVILTFACALALLAPGVAPAQFGAFPMNLPQADFTWIWGNRSRAEAARTPDLNIRAPDSGFDCTLRARMRVGGRWSFSEIRDLEQEIRRDMRFIESVVNHMNWLEFQRDIDWARLDCVRMEGGRSSEPEGPQTLTPWIELEVSLHEDFGDATGRDSGYWTATFRQAQTWRVRASRVGPRGTYSIRSEGLLLPSSLSDIDAHAEATCRDQSGNTWRTEWGGPGQPLPVSLNATNDNGQLVLWASVPEVALQHPGHAHIPQGSSCRAVPEPFLEYFRLGTEPLQRAGAEVDANGAFRLATLPWGEVADAAEGQGPPVTFAMTYDTMHDGRRIAFTIHGVIDQPGRSEQSDEVPSDDTAAGDGAAVEDDSTDGRDAVAAEDHDD